MRNSGNMAKRSVNAAGAPTTQNLRRSKIPVGPGKSSQSLTRAGKTGGFTGMSSSKETNALRRYVNDFDEVAASSKHMYTRESNN